MDVAQTGEKYDMQRQMQEQRLAGQKKNLPSSSQMKTLGLHGKKRLLLKQQLLRHQQQNLTKGEEAADKSLQTITKTGYRVAFSSVQSNLDKMQGALAELDGEDEMGKAWLPDAVRAGQTLKRLH